MMYFVTFFTSISSKTSVETSSWFARAFGRPAIRFSVVSLSSTINRFPCLLFVVCLTIGTGIFVPQNSQYLPTVPSAPQLGHIAIFIIFKSFFEAMNSTVCAIHKTTLLLTSYFNFYLPFIPSFKSCIAPLAITDTLKECILLNSFCALLLLLSDKIKASTGVSLGTCNILSET